MAFGGAAITQTLQDNYTIIDEGHTLGIGTVNIAFGGAGEFTTSQTPAAFQDTLGSSVAQGWGPGPDNWLPGDENRVLIEVFDMNPNAQGGSGETSLVHVVAGSPRIVNGNFVCTIHNRGLQVTSNLRFRFVYSNPIRRGSRRP